MDRKASLIHALPESEEPVERDLGSLGGFDTASASSLGPGDDPDTATIISLRSS